MRSPRAKPLTKSSLYSHRGEFDLRGADKVQCAYDLVLRHIREKESAAGTLKLAKSFVIASIALLLVACSSSPSPSAPAAKAQRDSVAAVDSPAALSPAALQRAEALSAAVSEGEGEWVTSSGEGSRIYYYKSDPDWRRLKEEYRVWFKSLEDLKTVYPGRLPNE